MSREHEVGPFSELRAVLHDISHEPQQSSDTRVQPGQLVRPDPERERRAGVPEVVFGGTKPVETIIVALRALVESNGRALASRIGPEALPAIRRAFDDGYDVEADEVARTVVVARSGCPPLRREGVVGVLAAGTSDIPVAAEAVVMAREMGADVSTAWDVGVAGLHRLIAPLAQMIENNIDVLIVAAGMDGALPSVVAGLVPVPVIGLPTSVGYGYGGEGQAALLSMLQSCAPGLVVVNIDNGIGAGATAAMIANRVAAARQAPG